MEPGEAVEDCIEPEKANSTMEPDDVDMSSEIKQEETEENKINTKESPICENDSNFAVICSFIEQFGTSLDLHLDIAKLKSMLETNDTSKEFLQSYSFYLTFVLVTFKVYQFKKCSLYF